MFERLVAEYVWLLPDTRSVRLYGRRGQADYGLDAVTVLWSGEVTVYQAKRSQELTRRRSGLRSKSTRGRHGLSGQGCRRADSPSRGSCWSGAGDATRRDGCKTAGSVKRVEIGQAEGTRQDSAGRRRARPGGRSRRLRRLGGAGRSRPRSRRIRRQDPSRGPCRPRGRGAGKHRKRAPVLGRGSRTWSRLLEPGRDYGLSGDRQAACIKLA